MFYENAEFQLASFHVQTQRNNNALIDHREENRGLHHNSIINIVLLGDKNIGKSRLIKQFTESIFVRRKKYKKQSNTLDILYKPNNRSNGIKLRLKFHSINLKYQNEMNLMSIFSYADCLLFVFDINNQISFNHLIDRCFTLLENFQSEHIFSYSLIGVKHRTSRQVTSSQVDSLIKKFKVFYYEITSSSNYEDILKQMLDKYFKKTSEGNSLFNMIKNLNKLCNIYRSYIILITSSA